MTDGASTGSMGVVTCAVSVRDGLCLQGSSRVRVGHHAEEYDTSPRINVVCPAR
ncbi:hypothetical protein ACFH04_13640 [Streptomyces noboritoensis]|uniref:Uncharacterized protein n=1 Tax=Streptomyces noboritoensis TaxID=67337 RepID=A0ABV6TG30_9ACTN